MATNKLRRGFAAMDPDRVREIARKGGQAAHRKGTAHRWDEKEAIEAGRKGGFARQRLRQCYAEDAADGIRREECGEEFGVAQKISDVIEKIGKQKFKELLTI